MVNLIGGFRVEVKMFTDKVREFMLGCPYLSGTKLNINCLGIESMFCTIDNVAVEPVIKKYCDGGTLKQARFILAIRDRYDENVNENLKIAMLLEEIEDWIYEQNENGVLPELDDEKRKCVGIEVVKTGHLYDTSMGSGRWQIEFRIVYRQTA